MYFVHLIYYVTGDSLTYHDGMMFTTKSRDNDRVGKNCAIQYEAPWWYDKCHTVLLTGHYGPNIGENKGIKWKAPWGNKHTAKTVVMMISSLT